MAVTAMKADSSRKLSWTIPRRNPVARRTPICWRRSTTDRADDAEGGDADDQPETHEAEQEPVDRVGRPERVVQRTAHGGGFHPVLQERALAVCCEVHSPAISIGTVSASTPITVSVLVVPVRGSRDR